MTDTRAELERKLHADRLKAEHGVSAEQWAAIPDAEPKG